MPVRSNLSKIKISGTMESGDCLRLLAAMHSVVKKKGFSDFSLDFSGCTKAYAGQMLLICSRCQFYWNRGIDISLTLPDDRTLRNLFLNTNWASLMDVRDFEPSRHRGYTHAPAFKFTNGTEQHEAVSKFLDILMAAVKDFSRDELRYIEWALNEITDNVINHSESPVGGLVQVTNFRQRRRIEVVVCDSGIGIPKSLRDSGRGLDTDQEALEVAIKEGVTRDKNFGQGNGLYGTWRIAHKSGGEFQIMAGHAELNSSEHQGLHIRKRDIPVNGTLVRATFGYNQSVDLSDALEFAGKKHIPVDYIETHYEEDDFGNLKFVLKEESNGFGSRASGEPVRRKLQNCIRMLDRGKVVVDCENVPFVSSSFADEVFGKLFVEIGPVEFSGCFQLVNVDPLVKGLIDRAITQRMSQ